MAGFKFGNKANFGENTTLSGSFQYVFGSGNSNSADYTMVGGINNTVISSGEESLVWGSGNSVSGANNLVFGVDHTIINAADFNIVGGTTCSGTSGTTDYNRLVGYSCKSTNRGNLTYGRNNINDTDTLGMGYHMVGGSGNTVSGSYFGITVGEDNIAPEEFQCGLQIGESGSTRGPLVGAISTAAGGFAAKGDAQLTSHVVYRGQ